MKRVLQAIGRIAYICGWPAFWLYFKLDRGRTRVVVRRGKELLVVKQWIGDGTWQLPGGGMHKNESAIAAALRELQEETGIVLTGDGLSPAGKAVCRSHGVPFTIHVFAAEWPGGELRLQRHELCDIAWMNPGQLHAGNARDDLLVALQMLQ